MWVTASALAAVLFLATAVLGKPAAEKTIDESNLKDLLTENEWMFLFGDPRKDIKFSITNFKHQRRKRRSIGDEELLSIEAKSLQRKFELKLQPTTNLLDPEFLLVRRWANRSESISGISSQDDISDCFFRGENAALSLCGGVRGILTSEDKDIFTIHPLPERFTSNGSVPHVVAYRASATDKTTERTSDYGTCTAVDLDDFENNETLANEWSKHRRKDNDERSTVRRKRSVLPGVFVETAVFVDRDLFKHMAVNYPKNTERELVRFVLAMINAVQLLYHDPSLGRQVNFILKRLEILHEDPVNLKRPHDIDRFLSNFCAWQRLENPQGDTDPLHWDHALILTGLDLYVVSKHGKVSSQVVGLAPVAGMCTITSSCTVNEGRHFESVYVVAHEIGHNLGMRHDGPLAENECDPSSYVMSPTLGSGKITWSSCSRRYLQTFLETPQSRCLLDHSSSAGQLDHSAEGILPGERFDADQQCMLKYGRGSKHSPQQPMDDVCRDLHCQRDRYTWTSHPALEGTNCGDESWCRSGRCTLRALSEVAPAAASAAIRAAPAPAAAPPGAGAGWGRWAAWAECASGCLYGADGRLGAGSTGIMLANRRCDRRRPDNGAKHCEGHETKYQACSTPQCLNVPRMIVTEFADQICTRAREVDADLIGTGIQRLNSGAEDGCAVWCHTRGGGYKSRGWTFPDGTVCSTNTGKQPMYCISGKCQEFGCPDNQDAEFALRVSDCEWETRQESTSAPPNAPWRRATGADSPAQSSGDWRSSPAAAAWRGVAGRQPEPAAAWRAASGCHYHCIAPGSGLRLVEAIGGRSRQSIQLCRPDEIGCTQMKTPYQHATYVCSKYKDRVRRLSGLGMQISPALEDPDRPCRIACQDEAVTHRFYLVNGQEGWFPFGTACSKNKAAYCISGKCLDFGADDTPLEEAEFTLPLLSRSNSTLTARLRSMRIYNRHKRSLENPKIKVIAKLDQDKLDEIISTLNFTGKVQTRLDDYPHFENEANYMPLDFNNPIHIAPEETIYGRTDRHYMFWNT